LAGKIVVGLAILAGTALSLLASKILGLAFLSVPFEAWRLFFLLGLFPFCIGYLRTSLRQQDPTPKHLYPH
jgi:hypothetical protein